MNNLHLRMLCQTCSDKRRVQRAKDDAKRISFRLLELMGHRYLSNQRHQPPSQYFHTAVRCRMSGGACPQMATYERELRLAEQELDQVFASFRIYLEGLDSNKEAGTLRQKAFDILRGYYPQAARLMKP